MKRIFVAIASFCDEECSATISDMFAKAIHPERISVGICWQYNTKFQGLLCPLDKKFSRQVRQYAVHYSKSLGAGWARSKAHELYDGEDFILQIDSHMRFMPGWDSTLINQYEQAGSDKKLISAFCPNYQPHLPLDTEQTFFPLFSIHAFADDSPQIIHLHGTRITSIPARPFLSASVIFNFIFAPAAAFHQVPIDPHIYFKGAETTHAARFWTHGYDIYQPNKVIAFHRWDVPKAKYKIAANTPESLVKKRVFHVLGLEPTTDAAALIDIERYGLGHERSVADYFDFLGVNVKKKTISERGLRGQWDEAVFPNILPFPV